MTINSAMALSILKIGRCTASDLRQAVAEIPWEHDLVIINKVKDPSQRQWYVHQTIQNGWSGSILLHQIESNLYGRQVVAVKITSFPETLHAPLNEFQHN